MVAGKSRTASSKTTLPTDHTHTERLSVVRTYSTVRRTCCALSERSLVVEVRVAAGKSRTPYSNTTSPIDHTQNALVQITHTQHCASTVLCCAVSDGCLCVKRFHGIRETPNRCQSHTMPPHNAVFQFTHREPCIETVLFSTVLYCNVLRCAALRCAPIHSTPLHSTPLY